MIKVDRVAVVSSLLKALSEAAHDRVEELLADDVLFEAPYRADRAAVTEEGRQAVAANLRRFIGGVFSPITFTIDEIHLVDDGVTVVSEYRSDGLVQRTGAVYCNQYVGVFEVVDGRIKRWREYYDPTAYERSTQRS